MPKLESICISKIHWTKGSVPKLCWNEAGAAPWVGDVGIWEPKPAWPSSPCWFRVGKGRGVRHCPPESGSALAQISSTASVFHFFHQYSMSASPKPQREQSKRTPCPCFATCWPWCGWAEAKSPQSPGAAGLPALVMYLCVPQVQEDEPSLLPSLRIFFLECIYSAMKFGFPC